MKAFVDMTIVELNKSRAVIPNDLKQDIANCLLEKNMLKYRRVVDMNKYSQVAIEETSKIFLTDCFEKFSKRMNSSMYLKWDLLTFEIFKNMVSEIREFDKIRKDKFQEFCLRTYYELKKKYPYGMPLKNADNEFAEVLLNSILEIGIVREYTI
ncbi:hypothetical protein [Pedobacter sp. UBA4863]|uniref:hypothetical protein n=1 Tax=Pedobacter sp. UBA4863 TaxID=1947060 RepID=UPI0025FF0A2A|nr:hypothetical protein [Pedobacter sp. UBA4863]